MCNTRLNFKEISSRLVYQDGYNEKLQGNFLKPTILFVTNFKKLPFWLANRAKLDGGPGRSRTGDLHIANVAL